MKSIATKLPDETAEKFEALAKRHGLTRSAYLRRLVETAVDPPRVVLDAIREVEPETAAAVLDAVAPQDGRGKVSRPVVPARSKDRSGMDRQARLNKARK